MIIIDSPFHVSFTGHNELPTIACVGKCKKPWWPIDLEDVAKDVCPMCGSVTSAAMEGVHYSVLAQANRDLRYGVLGTFRPKVTLIATAHAS